MKVWFPLDNNYHVHVLYMHGLHHQWQVAILAACTRVSPATTCINFRLQHLVVVVVTMYSVISSEMDQLQEVVACTHLWFQSKHTRASSCRKSTHCLGDSGTSLQVSNFALEGSRPFIPCGRHFQFCKGHFHQKITKPMGIFQKGTKAKT